MIGTIAVFGLVVNLVVAMINEYGELIEGDEVLAEGDETEEEGEEGGEDTEEEEEETL